MLISKLYPLKNPEVLKTIFPEGDAYTKVGVMVMVMGMVIVSVRVRGRGGIAQSWSHDNVKTLTLPTKAPSHAGAYETPQP